MTAPADLRESFAAGVVEQSIRAPGRPLTCWLAQHDPRARPCSPPLERMHVLGRQRISNALYPQLREAVVAETGWWLPAEDLHDLIEIAEWDPRWGLIACEHHHRRYDSQATPALIVPLHVLPAHVHEAAADWGLEDQLERKCPVF